MIKKIKKVWAITGATLLCISLAGSGCGRKESDPASEQVLEISITPEPSPTPAPEEIDPAAVVVNGNITMVNSYLTDNPSSSEQTNENDSVEMSETEPQEDAGEQE